MITFTNRLILLGLFCLSKNLIAQTNPNATRIDHVLHISVDGLRPDIITSLGAQNAPNFFRFRTEGAWTDNARTDVLNTSTIPGHSSHITGRPVFGDNGHGFWWNSDPGPFTLHTKGYKASVFDVVHDYGLSTALYAGKSKFVLFENSYNAQSGATDITGMDNGKDKIDTYVYDGNMEVLATTFIEDYKVKQYDYAFFHFRNPDGQGHSTGWKLDNTTEYAEKVKEIDVLLASFFKVIETTPGLAGNTAIILTADHGGEEDKKNHGNVFDPDNYTIPFYVWGPGVARGADLYALNNSVRRNPGTAQPTDDGLLPIRYGEVANLALNLLGLPSIPGSVYNADQSLKITSPDTDIVVIQEGLNNYSSTKDTYIRRQKSDHNYGRQRLLLVDDADPWWSGRDNQTLLRFDQIIGTQFGQIPSGSFIENATLQVRVINKGKGGSFHRMLQFWDENVTWDSMRRGVSANDLEAKALADAQVSDVNKGILTIDVTKSIQAWADGEVNYGWAVLPNGGNGWDFYSSEGFMPPKLVIIYDEKRSSIYIANNEKPAEKKNTVEIAAQNNEIISNQSIKPLLWGNFPNPFKQTTTFAFSIAESQKVNLSIYDMQGRFLKTIIDEKREVGSHMVPFEATNLTKGIYIVKMIATGSKETVEQSMKIVLE